MNSFVIKRMSIEKHNFQLIGENGSLKYHFSGEQIERKVIKLNYTSTGNQQADILTKPVPDVKFTELRTGVGLQ